MTPKTPTAHRVRRPLAVALALALLAAGGVAAANALLGGGGKRITAYFDRTVSVHEGSDVRVLGVRVGQVDEIRPEGDHVEVELTVDEGVQVPEQVTAVVVAPSVVAGRFVQLSPAYDGGPEIQDGAEIPNELTATPVEVDELLRSVTELARVLGPDGANENGALAELIETGAENLDGNGKALGDSIHQLSGAAAVLNSNSGDLVETIEQLRDFTAMLKRNDGQVRTAERQLAEVTGFLAADKDDLAAALEELGDALGQVKGFIEDNRGRLKSNVDKLASLTDSLVDRRASLAEALDVLPLAAQNLDNAYNPETRTIDGRVNINELSMGRTGGQGAAAELTAASGSRREALPALPLPAVGDVYGTPEESGKGGDR